MQMQTWEYKILFSWSEDTKKGELDLDWEWVIEVKEVNEKTPRTFRGFGQITKYMNELGSKGWELIVVMPINWPGGSTDAFQMFFKRPISERERKKEK